MAAAGGVRRQTCGYLVSMLAVAAAITGVPASATASAAKLARIDASGFTLKADAATRPDAAGSYQRTITKLEADTRIKRQSLDSVVTTPSPGRAGRYPLCHSTRLKAALKPSGFCWDKGDDTTADWVPQGVTGSGDADASGLVGGRRLIAASWHAPQDKFVRISIADFTKPATKILYHHLLLVEPYVDSAGKPNFRGPANLHADGLLWYGDRLLVASGTRLQVYALDHIWKTRTTGANAGKIGLAADGAVARWHAWALGEDRRVSDGLGRERDVESLRVGFREHALPELDRPRPGPEVLCHGGVLSPGGGRWAGDPLAVEHRNRAAGRRHHEGQRGLFVTDLAYAGCRDRRQGLLPHRRLSGSAAARP